MDMPSENRHLPSLENILSAFFKTVTPNGTESPFISPTQEAIRDMYAQKPTSAIITFDLGDVAISEAINELKAHLLACNPGCLKALNTPLTYLLDEFICNIQQHAQTSQGYAYIGYNAVSDSIEIVIADMGITIYGSYIAAQKHLDKLGNSDAEALNLAQNGYSVKNLPNAENRGYGISSNIRMVVDGLHGELAVMSGNALLIQTSSQKEILSLPEEIDYKGTMVMVVIPASVPEDFNIYKYTN